MALFFAVPTSSHMVTYKMVMAAILDVVLPVCLLCETISGLANSIFLSNLDVACFVYISVAMVCTLVTCFTYVVRCLVPHFRNSAPGTKPSLPLYLYGEVENIWIQV